MKYSTDTVDRYSKIQCNHIHTCQNTAMINLLILKLAATIIGVGPTYVRMYNKLMLYHLINYFKSKSIAIMLLYEYKLKTM